MSSRFMASVAVISPARHCGPRQRTPLVRWAFGPLTLPLRKAIQFSFFVADQGYRFLKGIDGLYVTVNDLLHGFQGIWNVSPFWFVLWFNF